MKNEKEILANFHVEELEKRFEMSWVDSISIIINIGGGGTPPPTGGTGNPPPPTPPRP
jgi:hypothetical protein